MQQLCHTLTKTVNEYVRFDATNPEHIEAFKMLVVGTKNANGNVTIRQHPTVRFVLESPATNVRQMLMNKACEMFANQSVPKVSRPVKKPTPKAKVAVTN